MEEERKPVGLFGLCMKELGLYILISLILGFPLVLGPFFLAERIVEVITFFYGCMGICLISLFLSILICDKKKRDKQKGGNKK